MDALPGIGWTLVGVGVTLIVAVLIARWWVTRSGCWYADGMLMLTEAEVLTVRGAILAPLAVVIVVRWLRPL
jgi:hypothetical protein